MTVGEDLVTTTAFPSWWTGTTSPFPLDNVTAQQINDEHHETVPELDLAIAIVLGIGTVFSALFNCIMFYEFLAKLRKGKFNVSFYIYFHLLLSDLILCYFCAPFSIYAHVQGRSLELQQVVEKSVAVVTICNVSGFLYNVVSKVTVQLILLLTCDRWLTIVYPRLHRNHITLTKYRIVIATIWLTSILCACSPYFNGKVYRFDHKFLSLCSWDFQDLGVPYNAAKFSKRLTFLLLYLLYIIIPFLLPLLLTVFFAVAVIVRLQAIRKVDCRKNKNTARVTYAVNTVAYVTIFHLVCYALWYLVIVSQLANILGFPWSPTQYVTSDPVSNHLFTSYPLGAYLNAVCNPLFLYWRILKCKLSILGQSTSSKSGTGGGTVRVTAVEGPAAKVHHAESRITPPSAEVVRVVQFTSPVSLRNQVMSRVSSAQTVLRNFTRGISLKEFVRSRPKPVRVQSVAVAAPARQAAALVYSNKAASPGTHPPQQPFVVTDFSGPSRSPTVTRVRHSGVGLVQPIKDPGQGGRRAVKPFNVGSSEQPVDQLQTVVTPMNAVTPIQVAQPLNAVTPIQVAQPLNAVMPIRATQPLNAVMPIRATQPLNAVMPIRAMKPLNATRSEPAIRPIYIQQVEPLNASSKKTPNSTATEPLQPVNVMKAVQPLNSTKPLNVTKVEVVQPPITLVSVSTSTSDPGPSNSTNS